MRLTITAATNWICVCTAEIIQKFYFFYIFATLSQTPCAVVADPSLENSTLDWLLNKHIRPAIFILFDQRANFIRGWRSRATRK